MSDEQPDVDEQLQAAAYAVRDAIREEHDEAIAALTTANARHLETGRRLRAIDQIIKLAEQLADGAGVEEAATAAPAAALREVTPEVATERRRAVIGQTVGRMSVEEVANLFGRTEDDDERAVACDELVRRGWIVNDFGIPKPPHPEDDVDLAQQLKDIEPALTRKCKRCKAPVGVPCVVQNKIPYVHMERHDPTEDEDEDDRDGGDGDGDGGGDRPGVSQELRDVEDGAGTVSRSVARSMAKDLEREGDDPPPASPTPPQTGAAVSGDRRRAGQGNQHQDGEQVKTEILAFLTARRGDWYSRSPIAEAVGAHPTTVAGKLMELRESGDVEHNGKGGAWSKVRVPPDEQATAEPSLSEVEAAYAEREEGTSSGPAAPGARSPTSEEIQEEEARRLGEVAARQRARGVAAPAAVAPMSPRVRRELLREREEREDQAERDRVAQRQRTTTQGMTFAGRILGFLQTRNATVQRIASALSSTPSEVAAELAKLQAEGDVLYLPAKREWAQGL